MKKTNITLTLVLITNLVFSQQPLVKKWDYRFGGTAKEILYSFQSTFDKGFILGGYSISGVTGDISQPAMGGDFWIIKTDSMGAKQWDKRFGGFNEDGMLFIHQTADSGYVLCGRSLSGVGGDKTEPGWGGWDFWIVKIDAFGTKQWDKNFGGLQNETAAMIRQTVDGGYILGGECLSGMSGDKTQANWDPTNLTADYWIVKIDAAGNKQWDKRFGGTDNDVFTSLVIDDDGGYLLGGYSASDSSGDKTQDTWGNYDYDIWIVKIDSSGNKLWDKNFGGTGSDFLYSIGKTNEGGFILGGTSNSGVSGDKTQPLWDTCANCYKIDLWIIKTDWLGNKQWEKAFGGFMQENVIGNITQTSDGGYLIGSTSYSGISGDKTENNLGREQSWILKTDSLANKQWDKTLRTACDSSEHDEIGLAYQLSNGCYVMANYTTAGIGGDKTQPSWDTVCQPYCKSDYWIIKFCDSTYATSVFEPISAVIINISPNPFVREISITIQKPDLKQATFTIRNILGQTIFRQQELNPGESYTTIFDLGFTTKGIYLFEIVLDGERTVKKIVKE